VITAYIDVDTQNDFMLPAGALYVPGAERILPAICRLNRHAAARGFTLISTVDAHAENDPEFRTWPAHCVAGTLGQRKPVETMVEQMIVEKQVLDCFASPTMRPVLSQVNADEYVVYGVVTEICVRFAAFGLLEWGKKVLLVRDAVRSLNDDASNRMLAEFVAAGGHVTTIAAMCAA
jgi:nicotinamidase/pyrazinamidase